MRKWIILAASIVLTIALDQLSKNWVINNLELYQSIQPLPPLAPLFQLTRSTNTGAAFGILPMAGNAFLLLAIVIITVMVWHLRGAPASARLIPFAIGIVIGGALGNVIDRLQYGHVVDFIHYQIPGLISNVSNLADHSIVLGVSLIFVESIWRERALKRSARLAQNTSDATVHEDLQQ